MTVDPSGPLRLVREPLALSVLQAIATQQFGDLVKAVVDIATGIKVIGAEIVATLVHADA